MPSSTNMHLVAPGEADMADRKQHHGCIRKSRKGFKYKVQWFYLVGGEVLSRGWRRHSFYRFSDSNSWGRIFANFSKTWFQPCVRNYVYIYIYIHMHDLCKINIDLLCRLSCASFQDVLMFCSTLSKSFDSCQGANSPQNFTPRPWPHNAPRATFRSAATAAASRWVPESSAAKTAARQAASSGAPQRKTAAAIATTCQKHQWCPKATTKTTTTVTKLHWQQW